MIDERFILHRYKSTSYAGIACAFMVVGLFAWNYFARDTFRADLFIIATATAATKLGFLTWYRLHD